MPGEIKLVIEVDDKGTIKVKQFADETKKVFDEMQKGPEASQGPLASLKESWMGLTAKVTAATAVIYGVGRALSSFINEAAQAEEIENRLRFALETTGYTWQYAKQAVDEFASSIQEMTRFSDEQARQALTDMMMYTNDFSKAQMGARLAMDMSIRTGQDLSSTSRLIGMAMSGNVEMLGRYIPELRNLDERLGSNATMAEKAEYTFGILQKRFGGTAQADIDSYAGKLAQFKNAWGELKETIGGFLIGPAKDLVNWLKETIQLWKEFLGKDPEDRRKRVLENQLKLLDDLYVKEQSLLESGKLRGAQIYLAEERINNILEQRKPIIEELSIIESKKEESKKRLAAETKKDVFFEPRKEADLKKEAEKFDPRTIVDQVHAAIAQTTREYEALGIAALDANQKMIDAWAIPSADEILAEIEKVIAAEEALGEAAVNRQELLESTWRMEKPRLNEMQTLWDNLAQGVSSSWSHHINNIIRGSESLKDGLKNIFKSIADAFISEISKMIVNWLLFENITGKTGTSGQKTNWGGIVMSILGVVGGLFGGGGLGTGYASGPSTAGGYGFSLGGTWGRYQHGGWITEPVIGVGKSGKMYSIGEKEAEFVTPKSKISESSRQEKTPITIINVVDSRQLDQHLSSSAGQNAVLNVISSRAGEIRKILS